MENPVDHIVDLGLVNYVRHPSDPSYIVYRFPDEERAGSFEKELLENKIWFERSEDLRRGKLYFLFGVHKNDFKITQKINYSVEAKHKKPFIPFKAFRIFLLLLSASLLILATIGYCNEQNRLASINKMDQSVNGQK